MSSPSSPRPQPAVTPTEPPARQLIQGELGALAAADLPVLRPAAPAARNSAAPSPAADRRQPRPGHTAPALTAALAGLAIAALVLIHAVHPGWGLIWLLWPALLIARRVSCH